MALGFGAALLLASGLALGWGARVLARLDAQVEARFQGRLFAVPSTVYSAPLVLYPGLDVRRAALVHRLERLRYRAVPGPEVSRGEFAAQRERIRIGKRPFRYPHRVDPGGVLDLVLDGDGRILQVRVIRIG